jgi:hypothetical protein
MVSIPNIEIETYSNVCYGLINDELVTFTIRLHRYTYVYKREQWIKQCRKEKKKGEATERYSI